MFADIHSHILHGIDDGPRDLEQARQCLSELSSGGVTHLAFTPHFYPDQKTVEDFLAKREKAYREILSVPEIKGITCTLGAEVYLTGTLFNSTDLHRLCYQGTSFMLTEPEYADSFTNSLRIRIHRLTEEHEITPILAHIDRYPFLWKDEKCLSYLRDMGCLFQVNLSSFLDTFSRYRALYLADKGLIHFLGEDVHHWVIPPEKRDKKMAFWEKKRPELLSVIAKKAEEMIFPDKK